MKLRGTTGRGSSDVRDGRRFPNQCAGRSVQSEQVSVAKVQSRRLVGRSEDYRNCAIDGGESAAGGDSAARWITRKLGDQGRVGGRGILPELRARGCIDGIETTVAIPDIDFAIVDYRRRGEETGALRMERRIPAWMQRGDTRRLIQDILEKLISLPHGAIAKVRPFGLHLAS